MHQAEGQPSLHPSQLCKPQGFVPQPLLQHVLIAGGQSKLIFKPDLTLEEVQAKNPEVSGGRYRPEECKALQRVAILIPHRNREKHLIYLLEHLHPFLQRQQLDYGIYIIHQVSVGLSPGPVPLGGSLRSVFLSWVKGLSSKGKFSSFREQRKF